MRSSKSFAVAGIVLSSFLSLSAHGAALSGASLFRGDASGNNLNGEGGILFWGGWTTVLHQQNVPGNYGYNLFLAQTPTPSAADFLTPSAALSVPLSVGDNYFYFWADNDDLMGGTATFGLNLFFNGAGPTSPSLSAYVAVGMGETVYPNSSPNTSGLNFQYMPGTGALGFLDGSHVIVLSSFIVADNGGGFPGPADVDLVNSDNTVPFVPPPHPNGVGDTYGVFTLWVAEIPEPSALAIFALGGLTWLAARRRGGHSGSRR